MRKFTNVVAAVLGLGGVWAGQASAVNTPDYDIPYVAAQFAHEFPDNVRDSKDGNGYQLTFGVPLNWDFLGRQKSALELTFYDVGRDRNLDGNKDYQSALTVDLVHDLGLFGWESKYLPKFKPYGLVGLGAVREDVLGSRHTHFGAEAGLGLLFPTSFYGLAVRTETRVLSQENDRSVAGQSNLIDYRVSVGLQLPLTPFFDRGGATVAPAVDCKLAVVDVANGRQDCVTDSDHDGVADSADQCPGTPHNTVVDLRGCPTGEAVTLQGVEFDTSSARLTENSKKILDGVAATLTAPDSANVTVEIGGHTDDRGSDAYNQMLSGQRAEAVRQYLIRKGVSPSRLKTQAYGKNQPVGANDSEQGRAENRRAGFRIVVD